jgi:hypothetical protein
MVSVPAATHDELAEDGRVRAAWGRIGSIAGYVAAGCLVGQTTLFLLDTTDALHDSPELQETDAGRLQDLATYYAAYFDHQHQIVWSIITRDVLGPVAFLALMVAALAAFNLARSRRPEPQVFLLCFVVGGTLAVLSDVVFLTLTRYWEHGGWSADPPANMVAVGRAVEAVDGATTYPQYAAFLVLALGLFCLGRIVALEPGWSPWLGRLAYLEALGLVVAVVAAVRHYDTAYSVVALAIGVLLGPAVAVLLGRTLSRAGRRA